MKKLLLVVLLALGAMALVACGTDKEEDKPVDKSGSEEPEATVEQTELVIGASNVPHAEILEKAKPLLEEKGIELVIEKYQDYVLPNKDLESGDLDANYFQHIPYFEGQIADHGYDFVNASSIHVEPMALYSKKHDSVEDIPDGATILFSNSVADHGRALSILEEAGLIKLADGVEKVKAEIKDVVENPKNLKFDANYEAAFMPQLYNNDEGDALLINANYAIDAGLNPVEDSIALESTSSPYANIIAVRAGDENREDIKTLIEVLTSKEIQDFILGNWNGMVVPVK